MLSTCSSGGSRPLGGVLTCGGSGALGGRGWCWTGMSETRTETRAPGHTFLTTMAGGDEPGGCRLVPAVLLRVLAHEPSERAGVDQEPGTFTGGGSPCSRTAPDGMRRPRPRPAVEREPGRDAGGTVQPVAARRRGVLGPRNATAVSLFPGLGMMGKTSADVLIIDTFTFLSDIFAFGVPRGW